MPTPRQAAACITTEEFIIVAGGHTDDLLDTVDVMNINTKNGPQSLPSHENYLNYQVLFVETHSTWQEAFNMVFYHQGLSFLAPFLTFYHPAHLDPDYDEHFHKVKMSGNKSNLYQ